MHIRTNNPTQYLFILMLLQLFFTGCKKYLTLQPEDQYTEEQVFGNETSVQQALNGLYVNLSDQHAYGFQLTLYAVEYMAQQYTNTNNTSAQPNLLSYNYSDPGTATIFQKIWSKAYQNILKTNKFLENLDNAKAGSVIPSSRIGQIRGEALAMRAMIHFDLLRLFGPMDPENVAIPYYSGVTTVTQPILSGKAVLDAVITDFNKAAELLENDPVITQGTAAAGGDYYTGYRNRRLNYFAVKGLLARAYLFGGNKQQANQLAKEVLDKGEKWFGWLPYTAILSAGANPDRIFSTEVLFGIDNRGIYNFYTEYFASGNETPSYPLPTRLSAVFENNINDYRYTSTWLQNTLGWRTFSKFADIQDKTKPWRFLQPLLRKSELYYILAETENVPQNAIEYLNTVRFNRGLGNLPPTADLPAEITKEYQKEFYGEGQLFFYYKRRNTPKINNGSAASGTVVPNYVVPLPEQEINLR
jgi:hypothetical protein